MSTEGEPMITGLHIVGYVKTEDREKITSADLFRVFLSGLIESVGVKELGSFYHSFDGGGFTGVVCLSESHIAIHTWPELNYITLDVFLCNYQKNNEAKCHRLFDSMCDYFVPVSVNKQEIIR